MLALRNITDTTRYIASIRSAGTTIGFVPTMGALHEGHLSLIRSARESTGFVAASIFVNPIQFNNPEDLKKYPREEALDIQKLDEAGCGLVFIPTVKEMYPQPETIVYDFGHLDKVMEGKYRPGHFNGVAIVVKKLFDIIGPHKAFFGEKDFQQLVIIQHLVWQMKLPVEIVPCPTVRESDGLAMSSRNKRFTPEERALAPFIYQILQKAKGYQASMTVGQIIQWVYEEFKKNPAFNLEYFEVVDVETLLPVTAWAGSRKIIGCLAAHLGQVRLIDNIRFL